MLVKMEILNLILDSREYEVQFPKKKSTYENLHAQVDDHGRTEAKMKWISNYCANDVAISKANGWTTLSSGAKKRIITTHGWEVLVDVKDGTYAWLPLSCVTTSNPI